MTDAVREVREALTRCDERAFPSWVNPIIRLAPALCDEIESLRAELANLRARYDAMCEYAARIEKQLTEATKELRNVQ